MIALEQFQLMAGCPKVVAELWHPVMVKAMMRWDVLSPRRMAAFMAQTTHESGRFSRTTESLNYSAQGLADTWANRFSVDPKARPRQPNPLAWTLNRQPMLIANEIYAKRYGNGDSVSGDGWKFRGRGPIQITFHDNYLNCGVALALDLVASPELLVNPEWGAMSAGWFWKTHHCNELIDVDDFMAVTKVINAAALGYAERYALYKNNLDILHITGTPGSTTRAQTPATSTS